MSALPGRATSGVRRSIRVKWALATGLAATLPLGALAGVTLTLQRRGLEAAERELELAAVDQATLAVEGVFGETERAVRRTATLLADPRVQDEDLKLTLAREALGGDVVRGVAVFDAGRAWIGAIARPGHEVPRTFPGEPRDGGSTWGRDARGHVSSYLAPIVADGARTGWLVADLDPEELARRAKDVSLARFGRPDRVVVVPSEGLPDTPVGVTRSFVSPSGEAMVGTLRTLPERGLAVRVERPEAEAFSALATTRRALLALAGGIALVTAALGLALGRRAARPVESLSRLARDYGKKRFGAKSEVRTGDELEALGRDLERMAADIAEGEAEVRRRAAVEAGLARYLPAELARSVASGEADFALGGRRTRVTVLFADVAAFTAFAEKTPPEQVVGLLNELFAMLAEIVFANGGMVDKYLGDCVMAVFGASGATRDHVADGLRAATAMQRFVSSSASLFEQRFGFAPELGIGVATGEALLGNLGTEERMEFTVVGDTVNVASRLEGIAMPKQTLATAAVAKAAPADVVTVSLGPQAIRGKAEPIEIFEVRA